MNKIDPPAFNADSQAIADLSLNSRLKSYPRLRCHVAKIQAGYTQYLSVNGDVSAVAKVHLPVIVEKYLRNHYGSPPKAINFIRILREESDHLCCPMCGSFHCGTLDHVMPKADHASFAIFSRNLVPACKCNTKRRTKTVGANAGERVLHPYFDGILADRLVSCDFEDLGPAPRIELKVLIQSTHPDYAAVQFHIDNVVKRTSIIRYLTRCWSQLLRKPSLAVPSLSRNPRSIIKLRTILKSELKREDERHESKNNWQSIFLSGLLEDDVLEWLFAALNQPERRPNAPLVLGMK